MRRHKYEVSSIMGAVTQRRDLILDVMDDDEVMALMNLSKLKESGEDYRYENKRHDSMSYV